MKRLLLALAISVAGFFSFTGIAAADYPPSDPPDYTVTVAGQEWGVWILADRYVVAVYGAPFTGTQGQPASIIDLNCDTWTTPTGVAVCTMADTVIPPLRDLFPPDILP